MQSNQNSPPFDTELERYLGVSGQTPTLFESAVHCAVLADFGPLHQELQAIHGECRDSTRFVELLAQIALKACQEMDECPHPSLRTTIGQCYLRELHLLYYEHQSLMRKQLQERHAIICVMVTIQPLDEEGRPRD